MNKPKRLLLLPFCLLSCCFLLSACGADLMEVFFAAKNIDDMTKGKVTPQEMQERKNNPLQRPQFQGFGKGATPEVLKQGITVRTEEEERKIYHIVNKMEQADKNVLRQIKQGYGSQTVVEAQEQSEKFKIQLHDMADNSKTEAEFNIKAEELWNRHSAKIKKILKKHKKQN